MAKDGHGVGGRAQGRFRREGAQSPNQMILVTWWRGADVRRRGDENGGRAGGDLGDEGLGGRSISGAIGGRTGRRP